MNLMIISTDSKLNIVEAFNDGLINNNGYDPSISQTSKYLNIS